MEYQTENIQTYQQEEAGQDPFYLDFDLNVPDAEPDVKKVILAEGKIRMEDLQMEEQDLRVTGKLEVKILYLAEDGSHPAAQVKGAFPFEERIRMKRKDLENIRIAVNGLEVTASVIHSRKLEIRSAATLQAYSEGCRELRITTDVEEAQTDLCKKYEETQVLDVHTIKKDLLRIREEVRADDSGEPIEALLWSDVSLQKFDARMEQDALRVRGELLVFCLYAGPEGELHAVRRAVPFEGSLACAGGEASMYRQVWPELTEGNIELKMDEDGEMRIFALDAALEVRFVVSRERTVRYLADVYATGAVCTPKKREESAEQLLLQNDSRCKVSETLSLPEIKDQILKVCHSSGRIETETIRETQEGLLVEGVLHVCVLYLKDDVLCPVDSWQGMIPFSHVLECAHLENEGRYHLTKTVEQLSVSLLGGEEMEIRALLGFHCMFRRPVSICQVEEIGISPADPQEVENRPGLVGYLVQPGDCLWDLAKKYQTTEENIRKVNDLQTEEIKSGDKLLIFKENMSIL